MVYFLPNDRPYREEVVESMKEMIAQVQVIYSEQMHAHGYGNRTFQLETDEHGDAIVHRVDGQHPDSNYLDNTFDGVMSEIREVFDIGRTTCTYSSLTIARIRLTGVLTG